MKILILNWKDLKNPDVGGAEIITYELAKRLVRKGHRVTWFCRLFPGAKKKERVDGITIIRQGNLLTTYPAALFYYFSLKKKPDLVIDMINTLCWQTPLYVRGKKVAYLNQLAKEVFFYLLPKPLSWIAYYLESWEYKTYKRTPFLCYSQSTKDDLVSYGIPEKNVHVFPLGVDHRRYIPGKKSKEPLFLFVGRLSKMKRPELCVSAMTLLVKKYPQARLALVGHGPEEENLQKMIKAKGLTKNVLMPKKDIFYFKKVKGDIKVRLMQQAWALLLPSIKEGWGMVVTEAAACGTPSIVTNVSGLKDSVVKDKTGFVLSPNPTAKELASAMEKIIKDKKLREKLSQNAIAWAKNFSWEKSFNEFYKKINKIINQKTQNHALPKYPRIQPPV